MHRLDQLSPKKPAKLLDYLALTLNQRCKQIWTGFFRLLVQVTVGFGLPYRDFWPASQFGGQMPQPLCRNYCVLSECAVIQTRTAVADR